MRTTFLLTLAMVPAALIAQAPAPAPAPAPAAVPAPAAAPLTFSERFKAEQAAINQLLKAFQPEEALAKAEALLPATRPAFDQSSLSAGRACSFQFSDLARTYHLAGKAAVAAGNWEKGRDYFIKAQGVAQENFDQTTILVAPTIESWKAPVAAAQKALDDGAARRTELMAKQPPLTPAEETELKNFKVHEQNIANGKKVTRVLGQDVTGTKTELAAFGPMIDSIKKGIEDEKTEMDKDIAGKAFKGNRAKYLAAILNAKNLESRTGKQEKLNFLFRLKVHCADTPQAEKVKAVIERVRKDEEPFPPEKHGKKKKQS